MNITVKKGEKELVFKYSTRKSDVQKGNGAKLVFHVWACDGLPTENGDNEVFFGAYSDDLNANTESLQERALKAINTKLSIVASAEPVVVEAEVAIEEKSEEILEPKTEENGDLSN